MAAVFSLKTPCTSLDIKSNNHGNNSDVLLTTYRLGGTCSHVGATLYKIEAAVRIGMTTNVPTDLPCQWNQTFTKSIVGLPVTKINLYSDAAKEKLSKSSIQTKRKLMAVSDEDKTDFIKELHDVQSKTVALHLFKDYDDEFIQTDIAIMTKLSPCLRTFSLADKSLDTEDFKKYCEDKKKEIYLSPDVIVYVEEATRNQSCNHAWFEQRAGRITGSTIYQVSHAKGNNPPKSLILKICSINEQNINTPPLMWGKRT